MKTLHPGLAAHLAGGVTTLARCWRLTRRDGVVMGFTDHDGDLAFDAVVHRARSGLEPSEAEAELGFVIASGIFNARSAPLKITSIVVMQILTLSLAKEYHTCLASLRVATSSARRNSASCWLSAG
jgi:hypothetical protein